MKIKRYSDSSHQFSQFLWERRKVLCLMIIFLFYRSVCAFLSLPDFSLCGKSSFQNSTLLQSLIFPSLTVKLSCRCSSSVVNSGQWCSPSPFGFLHRKQRTAYRILFMFVSSETWQNNTVAQWSSLLVLESCRVCWLLLLPSNWWMKEVNISNQVRWATCVIKVKTKNSSTLQLWKKHIFIKKYIKL